MTLKRELQTGEKITVFSISDFAATTHRHVWTVTGKRGERYTGKLAGKRKEFYLNLDGKIVLAGDSPIKADTDFSSYNGNACFNLVGTSSEVIRQAVNNSLTELPASIKGSIIFFSLEKMQEGILTDGEFVFPEFEN